jgi:hypothetical protein
MFLNCDLVFRKKCKVIKKMNHLFNLKLSCKLFRGITDVNKSYFYPSYSFRKATLGPKTPKITYKLKGTRLGKKLDSEISKYFKTGIESKLPHFKLVLDKCNEQKYTIVGTQIPVRNIELNLATCLDLVVFDGIKYIIIELKTGYSHYKYRHTIDNMNFPFNGLTDCPFNQHQLQTFVGHHLFTHTYPTKKVESKLWYVNKTIEEFDVSFDVWENCKQIFINSISDTKKNRKTIKRKAAISINKRRKKKKIKNKN